MEKSLSCVIRYSGTHNFLLESFIFFIHSVQINGIHSTVVFVHAQSPLRVCTLSFIFLCCIQRNCNCRSSDSRKRPEPLTSNQLDRDNKTEYRCFANFRYDVSKLKLTFSISAFVSSMGPSAPKTFKLEEEDDEPNPEYK